MTTTMSRTAAIRQAKSEVQMYYNGDMPGGYRGYRVSVYDHGYEAWVPGQLRDYHQARTERKAAVVMATLHHLGVDPTTAGRVYDRLWSGHYQGRSAEQILREAAG